MVETDYCQIDQAAKHFYLACIGKLFFFLFCRLPFHFEHNNVLSCRFFVRKTTNGDHEDPPPFLQRHHRVKSLVACAAVTVPRGCIQIQSFSLYLTIADQPRATLSSEMLVVQFPFLSCVDCVCSSLCSDAKSPWGSSSSASDLETFLMLVSDLGSKQFVLRF